MAGEMNQGQKWIDEQVAAFSLIAANYVPGKQ
jgi:hypothetical protein